MLKQKWEIADLLFVTRKRASVKSHSRFEKLLDLKTMFSGHFHSFTLITFFDFINKACKTKFQQLWNGFLKTEFDSKLKVHTELLVSSYREKSISSWPWSKRRLLPFTFYSQGSKIGHYVNCNGFETGETEQQVWNMTKRTQQHLKQILHDRNPLSAKAYTFVGNMF